MRWIRQFAMWVTLSTCALVLFGQSMVQLAGRITDASGAVIPNAAVTAMNSQTGIHWETTTSVEGYYVFPLLPAGSYNITARKQGFQVVTRAGLTLDTASKRSVDIELPVGPVTQSVVVTARAPLTQTQDFEESQNIERAFVRNMPLVDQTAAQLARLSGAYVGSGTSFSLAGGEGANQNWLLDGTTVAGSTLSNPALVYNPPADAIQEFTVELTNYSSEYGRSAGGEIVMTTRSGTNQFHGSAYEFLRNNVLDSRTFFEPSIGPLRYNIFGATLGGPIKKDKLFFFFNYQGTRQRVTTLNSATVPNAPEVNGDFSNRTDLTVINPATGAPFTGNIIPISAMDPVGMKTAKLYPVPNYEPDITKIEGTNYMVDQSTPTTANWYTARLDYNLSDKNRFTLRLLVGPSSTTTPALFPTSPFSFAKILTNRADNPTIAWIHQFSPNIMNEFRYNLGYYDQKMNMGIGTRGDVQVGLTGTNPKLTSDFSPTGFTGLADSSTGGGGSTSYDAPENTQDVIDNLSIVHGRHMLKTGVEYRYGGALGNSYVNSTDFAFSDRVTGSGLAEMLLGGVDTAFNQGNWNLHGREDYYAGYVQDEWRATSRLTLNVGLRWEMETPRWDTRNQQAGMDLNAINPVCNCPGVVTFAGRNGASKYASNFDWNNFGPRVGFAYQASHGLVIRSGYAIHYNPLYYSGLDSNDLSAPFIQEISFSSPDNGITPAFFLRGGQPAVPANQPFNSSFGAVPIGQNPYFSPSFIEPNHVAGYSQQWNFTVQKMLRQTLVEVAYLGNVGHKLGGEELNINVIPLVNGEGPAVASLSMLRFPQFGNDVADKYPNWGNSSYHALNVKLERRYSNGLDFLVNYTWSKYIDNIISKGDIASNPKGDGYTHPERRQFDKSLSGDDVPQRLVASGVYDLPFGPERHWNLSNGAARQIAGGWGVGLISEFRKGMPFGVAEQTNLTNTFSSSNRPFQLVNPLLASDRPLANKLAEWFNTAAFQAPPVGIFGNGPRLEPGGPDFIEVDASVHKNWNLTEHDRLLFRTDFYNLPNHPNFAEPNSQQGSGSFGKVSSILKNSTAREIQFSLRFEF